jgi:hypothetical protein
MSYDSLSSSQLQTEGLRHAQRLREFQNEIIMAGLLASQRRVVTPGETDEQATSRRSKERKDSEERSAKELERFRSEFRTESVLLYQELLRRNGETKRVLPALDYGMLAGPSPLEDVAHEIERLSKSLSMSARPN